MIGGEPCGGGALAEVREQLREAVRVVVVRHVPGAREDLEPAARDRLVGGAAVARRDDAVAFAPHDQRGQLACEVQAIVRAHALSAGVDHRADRMQERLP
jgi:hypothetical protein